MKDNDQLFDIEKTIGGYMRKSADNPAPPPFAGIAGRIAAGQPAESFEAFFGGDIPGQCSFQAAPVRRSGSAFPMKIIAGAVAAALVLTIGGGVMMTALLKGASLGSKSAADSAERSDSKSYPDYENYDYFERNEAAADMEETGEEYVSDSDATGSDDTDSSDSPDK